MKQRSIPPEMERFSGVVDNHSFSEEWKKIILQITSKFASCFTVNFIKTAYPLKGEGF